MNPAVMMKRIAEASPRLKGKIAGVSYWLTILTGAFAAVFVGRRFAVYGDPADLIATSCYIVVTLLFYDMSKPVSRRLSLLAAFFSLVGCAIGALFLFHLATSYINNLVFFGFYCLLIGYLIFRSTFLPRILAVPMAFAGLGWLTLLSPTLANHLVPLYFCPWQPQGGIADPVAPRDRRERSTMDGAGQRSPGDWRGMKTAY